MTMRDFPDEGAKAWIDAYWKPRFKDQKYKAKERGIDFLIDYENWLSMWLSSGQAYNRGVCAGQYCMARYLDDGPYSMDNVRITTVENNHKEWMSKKFTKGVEWTHPVEYKINKHVFDWVMRKRYVEQKGMAKTRKIEFKLSFPEWLRIWIDSGKLFSRGVGIGNYCMLRNGDSGAYEVGNVRIDLFVENNREANLGKIRSRKTRSLMSQKAMLRKRGERARFI